MNLDYSVWETFFHCYTANSANSNLLIPRHECPLRQGLSGVGDSTFEIRGPWHVIGKSMGGFQDYGLGSQCHEYLVRSCREKANLIAFRFMPSPATLHLLRCVPHGGIQRTIKEHSSSVFSKVKCSIQHALRRRIGCNVYFVRWNPILFVNATEP